MTIPLSDIRVAASQRQAAMIDFTQQMVRIPSLPGHERDVALAIQREMERLAYDDVWVDEAGNVIGRIKGGDGPTVLLNGHMDHVDPGPAEGWPQPPFSGVIIDGELWGRASVDMKGPVACMIYAASLFKSLKVTPPGDIYMTVAVMEEIGGLGTEHLTSQLRADAAICGEPSRNILRRGHRGRIELNVIFKGRSAHASVPHLAVNPHYEVAAFLSRLPEFKMASDVTLGSSSVAPTLYATDQLSPNVTPGEVKLTLDWRNVPSESPEEIVAKLQALLDESLAREQLGDASRATVQVTAEEFTTYTGMTKTFPSVFPAFILSEADPFVKAARTTLTNVLGRDEGVDTWKFATDGGHLMEAGIPTIGFGPGDERLAHTNQERISLAQMEESTVAYVALILTLAEVAQQQA